MTIIFANQKGGVGKTTTALNVSAYMAALGKRVLLVDLDPQANATSALRGRNSGLADVPTTYEVIIGATIAREAIQKTNISNLFLIPASSHLAAAAVELADARYRETYLDRALMPITRDYDFIFIDAPPGLGILTINGFIAAHHVIIPVQCEYYALEGMIELTRTIQKLNMRTRKKIGIMGVVLTMFDRTSKLSHAILKEVRSNAVDHVFKSAIPRNTKLAEAPSFGKTILEYDPYSHGAKAYYQLTEEIVGLVG
jgi:chromosome partitioning protein